MNVNALTPAAVMQLVPLELMATGEHGKVHDVDGSHEFVVRLQELGLQAGVEVQMVKTGSPCILAINKQRFSLRFDDQASVLVEVTR
ncbi:MAG: FeoA domain-containing protein [Candidatus Saccharimonas sp.]|nr:FeoA domain-containing protein [Planctomycetaceae bacterium]